MGLEFKFTCPLPNGVHARPASALEEVARRFAAEISVVNDRNGRAANAKSVLALVGADIRLNDRCRLSLSGADAEEALAALSGFLRDEFPNCDHPLPGAANGNGDTPLPPALRAAGASIHHGTAMVRGIGCGRIVQSSGLRMPEFIPTNGAPDFALELRKLDDALSSLIGQYEARLTGQRSRVELELIKAHRSVARDPEFRARLREALRGDNRTAAGAITEAEAHFSSVLAGSGSLLLRERALDIQDVCFQLLRQIYGRAAAGGEVHLKENSVVVADTLTPEQFLALDRKWLKGLVLGHAGSTSHTVILARSFGIPTLTGVVKLAAASLAGQEAVVDAELGVLVTQLTDSARRYYAMEERRLSGRALRQRQFAARPGSTADGTRLAIAANITTADEAGAAFDAGAEGIGLFRSEMLFLERDAAPDEQEQFEQYVRALAAADGRPVIVRTLDIGGDKPLAYLNLPVEDNPFLGYRAVRIYPEFEALFRTQIHALVRASAHGQLKVMVPMVSSLEEVRWARGVIKQEQRLCAQKGVPFDRQMQLGAMIEVPAAAFLIDLLSRELDFFSIGSNDLLQCFVAADRTNPRLATLHDPLQPAFLRLLKKIVAEAHGAGKRVGLCGEMGGDVRCLPLLVGLGVEEISAAPSAILALKAEVARWPTAVCRRVLDQALSCAAAEEVRQLLAQSSLQAQTPSGLIDPELIVSESASSSKHEAIKEAVDRLFVVGRTEVPRAVEEAVWQREQVYSTGLGNGFAIPHCKTDAVSANSLALLKLRSPMPWDSSDGQPVRTILLLVIRESGSDGDHMRIFSHLARKLMHADFCQRLEQERDPAALCALLNESVRPTPG